MDASQAGAVHLARKLSETGRIRRIFYPGLETHPGKHIHDRQASGPGAVMSFELESAEHAGRFLAKTALPLVSVSLGGVESILSHPATMSHAAMPADERAARGISDALIRFSVGLEAPEDLWADIRRALEA
jgi:cystathionine beta-lyase/cystathionine gamma-synthase